MSFLVHPDVLRNSTRSYRSYKEATGTFAKFEEESNDRWNKITIICALLILTVVAIFIGD